MGEFVTISKKILCIFDLPKGKSGVQLASTAHGYSILFHDCVNTILQISMDGSFSQGQKNRSWFRLVDSCNVGLYWFNCCVQVTQ